MSKQRTLIEFPNGIKRGLITRYYIPKYMHQYFFQDTVIHYPGGSIDVPYVDRCQLCDTLFLDATKPLPMGCQSLEVNKAFGYMAKICVDCSWYIEQAKGSTDIPKSISLKLDQGHRPKRLVNLIN